jgi:hypothetical protein
MDYLLDTAVKKGINIVIASAFTYENYKKFQF